MATRYKPKKYTFTGTSPVSLWVMLGSPDNDEYASSIVIRAANDNAGTVYWCDSTGNDLGGYLEASEAASFDLTNKYVSNKLIYFKGAVDDDVYLTALG